MFPRILLPVLLCAGGILWAAAASDVPSAAIPRFAEVKPNLYRGGQPTLEGMRELSQRGVKTIISLRPANEYPSADQRVEEAYAAANGITLRRVPILLDPDQEQIDEAIRLIQAAEGPVFVHCYYGSERTGVIIGSYRVRVDGWTVDQALAEADQFGIDFRDGNHRELLEQFAAGTERKPDPDS